MEGRGEGNVAFAATRVTRWKGGGGGGVGSIRYTILLDMCFNVKGQPARTIPIYYMYFKYYTRTFNME